MKLGISSYTYTWSVGIPGFFPDRPWDEKKLVSQTVQLGLECLQIADNLPLHTFNEARLNELKKTAAGAGVELEVGARRMTLQHLLEYIRIADLLSAPLLRFVIEGEGFTPTVPEVVEIIRKALPELEKGGISLALENHEGLKTEEFEEIIRDVDSEHVGICLDTVNSMGAGEGIETVVRLLAPYTKNLHLKEFRAIRKPHMMGFTIEGCPFGTGQLPVEWILAQLGPGCRSAILEQWTPPETYLKNTLARERQWAEESIDYLKKHFFIKNQSK